MASQQRRPIQPRRAQPALRPAAMPSGASHGRRLQAYNQATGRDDGNTEQHTANHPGNRFVMAAAPAEPWQATAVDITRLDKADPRDRRRINNAWRALKAAAPAEAADIGTTFAALRKHFPDAGIEVPAATLN